MRDQQIRAVMQEAYRLLERNETPECTEEYWQKLHDDCQAVIKKYAEGTDERELAMKQAVAIYGYLEKKMQNDRNRGAR